MAVCTCTVIGQMGRAGKGRRVGRVVRDPPTEGFADVGAGIVERGQVSVREGVRAGKGVSDKTPVV